MSMNKKLYSSNKEDILNALAPLNQHVLDNRERLLKALAQRDYIIDKNGSIRWSIFLFNGNIKPIDKETEEKVKDMDLILKSKKFMDSMESQFPQYNLEIIEFPDGFQVNLSGTKEVSAAPKEHTLIDSISYFVWKYF